MAKANSARPIGAAELKKLAESKLKHSGLKCYVCTQLSSSDLEAVNQCLREGVSMVGLTRVMQERGYNDITINKVTRHRDNGHHK